MSEKIDIVIPSKDRAIQLELLLESIGNNLKNVGQITITWQAENEQYKEGYLKLKKKIELNDRFQKLRKNCSKIIWLKRSKLSEVKNAYVTSGENKYILPLCDDDFFYREYDLKNESASKVFFNNNEIICCSLRLGLDVSQKVPHSQPFYTSNNTKIHKQRSLLAHGMPEFIYPSWDYHIRDGWLNEWNSSKYLLWNWLEYTETQDWSCATAINGQIYRKIDFLKWVNLFGKENFLNIEGEMKKFFINKLLKNNFFISKTAKILDKLISNKLKKNNIYDDKIFETILIKYIAKKTKITEIPNKMVCPRHSCVKNLALNSLHYSDELNSIKGEAKQIIKDTSKILNDLYLSGKKINYSNIKNLETKNATNSIDLKYFMNYVE